MDNQETMLKFLIEQDITYLKYYMEYPERIAIYNSEVTVNSHKIEIIEEMKTDVETR